METKRDKNMNNNIIIINPRQSHPWIYYSKILQYSNKFTVFAVKCQETKGQWITIVVFKPCWEKKIRIRWPGVLKDSEKNSVWLGKWKSLSRFYCSSLLGYKTKRNNSYNIIIPRLQLFISNIKESGFLSHLLLQPMNVAHGYGLRSGFSRSEFLFVRTDRLSNFATHSYNRI